MTTTPTRTGRLTARTLSGYRDLLVLADDRGVRYLVGDTARSPDGYADLPPALLADVRWDDAP